MYDDEIYDDAIEADEDLLNKHHRQFTERQLKKHSLKEKKSTSQQAKLARISDNVNYDRNASGIDANSKEALKIPKKHLIIQPMPNDIEHQDELARGLLQWLQDYPDETRLEQYPLSKWISPYKFFKLGEEETNEFFSDCLEIARQEMANRGHKLLINHAPHLMRRQELDDTRLRSWIREKNDNAKGIKQGTVINVIANEIPQDPRVPLLKKDDE